jgi:2OG-Fe(II) oxygenase superfamily
VITQPFCIDALATTILADPVAIRQAFDRCPAVLFDDVFAPDLLDRLMRMASRTRFVPDVVDRVGTREIEHGQALGKLLNIVLARSALWHWLEQATGVTPIGGVSGQVVQTRPETRDHLDWHNDLHAEPRQLGVVIHLSSEAYSGGDFELREAGQQENLACFQHCRPGAMAVFAVRRNLEHRVTPLASGGPRRVYAGWFLAEPEHPHHGVVERA